MAAAQDARYAALSCLVGVGCLAIPTWRVGAAAAIADALVSVNDIPLKSPTCN